MSCEHEVRFTIKPTDDACRFHFDVRAYKDRIVAPDEYTGATTVTPSDETQVLATKDRLVREDITVNPAPTEVLSTGHNGTFTPSDGHVGFYQVDVDVNPDLRPLSVSENGSYEPDGFDGYSEVVVDVEPSLESLSVTENGLYLPESGTDGFDRVNVNVPVPSGNIDINQNGTYDVTSKVSATVDVWPSGYSDDINDFSGGNILALIGHAQEYIVTEYYPKLCTDYYLKLTKPTFYRNYEGFFSALFVNENARPGIQMANRSDRVNILVTRYIVAQNVALPLPTTDPTVWSTRCAMSGNALQTASKPLVIFHGYGASNLDVIGGFNFYGLKCYEFGKLVKKYVPWLDENNVPCVHELVDDEYFYNVGTGTFGYIDLEGNVHDA